ncbi:50S ribosomal protein L11 methyltransferase [Leucothrix pacifica]|uniref:Ribosomal protein L11 methyltransferase n=1 Tax=Leucothrix pacifica TaxID=1247513 RepID=A0A317CFI9_9GAMM|nr:50S ribosomal protein L11 methyltransferase [Leucothrix pacifica]PWQ94942.1 50S ribosomal protein L11 methyltransferase [Leucothrix pacifica]
MWLQLICQTARDTESLVSEAAENMGAASITLSDAGDNPVLEPLPNETPLWDDIIVTILFREEEKFLIDSLEQQLEASKEAWKISNIRQEELEEQQWERVWMDDFHPMKFGENLWIYPSWSDIPDDDSVKIKLDPGLAFGTGTHPTTALCMEWLDQNHPRNLTVVDYGCGSGILAIAAVKLGAKHVLATDIDPQALLATQDNNLKNDIPDGMIDCCLPEDMPESVQVDLMLANILCGPLIELSKTLCSMTKSGGHIVLSGIIEEQKKLLNEEYNQYCNDIQFATVDGWVRMTALVR